MGRPRKTEEPVKERKTRTRKVEEPEVKTEQIEDPVLDEETEEIIPEPVEEPAAAPDPEPEKHVDDYEVVNVTSFLNVREGPGKEYKSIWKLYNGDTVHISEIKDGWGRIDNYGWVSMDYLKKI